MLTGSKLAKKFPAFYRTRRFITAFTSARCLSPSWASSIHSMRPHPTYWKSILLSSHQSPDLPSAVFPQVFPRFHLHMFYSCRVSSAVDNKSFLSEVIKLTVLLTRPLNRCIIIIIITVTVLFWFCEDLITYVQFMRVLNVTDSLRRQICHGSLTAALCVPWCVCVCDLSTLYQISHIWSQCFLSSSL
jgi:hypothetical protein